MGAVRIRGKLFLPKPTEWGDFWLGEPRQAPAIIRSKRPGRRDDEPAVVDQGTYFVTTENGPLTDGRNIRQFKTPGEALAAIGG